MPTKYVTVDGTATHYFYTGPTTLPPNPPRLGERVLLFLHGDGSNAHAWHRQLSHFDRDALALDFPAHGRSGRTEGLGSVQAYRDFTVAFASAVGLPPCVLIGRSMGAAVAMEVAAAFPDRVRALVLVNGAARFDLPEERISVWERVMNGRQPQPFTADAFAAGTDFAVMREAWMEQVKTDPRVRHGDLAACAAFDFSSRLDQIRVPALVVAGREDKITPPEAAERLHAGIAGSRLAIVEGAGHDVPIEKPQELNAVIEEFVHALPN